MLDRVQGDSSQLLGGIIAQQQSDEGMRQLMDCQPDEDRGDYCRQLRKRQI